VKHRDDSLLSERLVLRRLTPDDLELVHRLNSDEKVMRYAGGTKDRVQTEAMLKGRILEYYEEHPGLGVWATLKRQNREIIGLHLLNHIQGESFIQVGYLLFPDHWGQGYATEMSIAVLRYGFTELKLPQIVAITDLANVESQHVLQKAGLHRKGERSFAHPAYAAQGALAWFERGAESWLSEHER